MNPFDERLDQALSSDTDDVAAPGELGDELIRRGRVRRRRNAAGIGGVSAIAIVLAGVAVVANSADDPGGFATDTATSSHPETFGHRDRAGHDRRAALPAGGD